MSDLDEASALVLELVRATAAAPTPPLRYGVGHGL
jgi:hypothetical protein